MAKLFDFECQTCLAIYEAWDNAPNCKHCGSRNVHKVFITPPGRMSKSTKFMDSTMQTLVEANGMTDYQNDPSRTHDKANQMSITALDPKKEIGDQVTDRISAMRGPVPYNHPKMGQVSHIPVMDPSSGDALRTVTQFNRKSRYREQATEYIGRIDKNGRVF